MKKLVLTLLVGMLTMRSPAPFVPPPIMIGVPSVVGSNVRIPLTWYPNLSFILLASTNLTSTNWVIISSGQFSSTGTTNIIDTNALALYSKRFYRALGQ